MSKGDQTRQVILQQAAQVFSVRGYSGASLDDLMQATQLTKGGIYNHFGSKEALALAAFDFAVERIYARFREMLAAQPRTTYARLMTVVWLHQSLMDDPILQGGCPVLNTAVEADDTNPPLRERAQTACDEWLGFITRTVQRGIELGDVQPEIIPEDVARVLIATLEGAIMLTKLYGDAQHMHRTVDYLTHYIESILI